jgi:dTMP kinase
MTEGRQGVFVTLEGVDGSGKTTQAALLAETLAARGHSCVLTREPGGLGACEQVRDLLKKPPSPDWTPLARLLLFLAARHQHVVHHVRPCLERGQWVVCDRFSDSTRVYQGDGTTGLPGSLFQGLLEQGADHLVPDLTFMVDVPPEVARQRLGARRSGEEADPWDDRDTEVLTRWRQGFLECAAREPGRFRVVDGQGEAMEVHQAIVESLEQWYEEAKQSDRA